MQKTPAAALPLPALHDSVPLKLLVAAALVGLADWLLYGYRPGVSVAMLLLAIGIVSLATNPVPIGERRLVIGLGILFAGLVPIIEDFNALSAVIGVIATAIAAASLTNPFIETLGDRLSAARKILFPGPFWLFADLSTMQARSLSLARILVWIVPLLLSGIFVVLFTAANPLIERRFELIEFQAWLSKLHVARVIFWGVVLFGAWPFISAKWRPKKQTETRAGAIAAAVAGDAVAILDSSPIFGAAAILRSLILFNLLFAVETVLDLIYLWGGLSLPGGLSYASYAHRGAYPLMLTALLAAAFVLAAMRPGGPAERMPIIRILVFVWVAQNVLLVVSSMLRLDLYVEVYSLTYWRVAAFVWMVLVALGLLLIIARIALNFGNRWLVNANLIALAAALYVCALINLPLLIANYNVTHSQEFSGKGAKLDFCYLASLGPDALPAIDRYLRHPNSRPVTEQQRSIPSMDSRRAALVSRHQAESANWRGWSLRSWRLQRYLDSISTQSAVTP